MTSSRGDSMRNKRSGSDGKLRAGIEICRLARNTFQRRSRGRGGSPEVRAGNAMIPRFIRSLLIKACLAIVPMGGAFLIFVPAARADYAVLRSGQRLAISGWERLGDTVRL